VTEGGHKIFLDTRDVGLTPHIALYGVWETHIEQLVRRLLRPGATVVEVGANMGYHTLAMAEAVGPTGRIHAFEANPRMSALLRDTIAVNGYEDRVTLHPLAAMDAPGSLSFATHPSHAGSGYVVRGAATADYTERVTVEGARIGDLLADVPALDLVRLDCEGSEPPALRGAESLLRRSPDAVIVTEWSTGMMSGHGPVSRHEAWLRDLGFTHCLEVDGQGGLVPRELGTLSEVVLADFVFSRKPLAP
jgi:FkbM family methyltransferase